MANNESKAASVGGLFRVGSSLAMTPFGTFRTCPGGLTMSVVRSRPEVAFRGRQDRC